MQSLIRRCGVRSGFAQFSCVLWRVNLSCCMHSFDGWLFVLGLTTLLTKIGPSPKERETEERKDRWVKCPNNPTRTYCKRSRPLAHWHQNCRTPRHWKITQGHRTTRPPTTFYHLDSMGSVFFFCSLVAMNLPPESQLLYSKIVVCHLKSHSLIHY